MLRNNAVYHHDCYSNFSDYKLNKKLKSKKRKFEKSPEAAGPSHSLRSQCENVPSNILCYICGNQDELCNLHAAGAKNATKDKLNYSYVEQQTIKWREMASLLGKEALLSRLVIGDVGSNSIFYHLICYAKFVKEYNAALMKLKDSADYIDVEAIQASAIDKVVGYICDIESENPGSAFFVDEMEGIYLTYLSEHGIERESHVSRFAPKILQELPDLETRKCGKRLVFFFSETINSVLKEYLSDHGGFIRKVRKLVTPIRHDMSIRKNHFSGSIEDGDQEKSTSILLLTLISMLVDGHADIENDCSQATLSIAQCITFNMRKSKKGRSTCTSFRRHAKARETPSVMYTSLKIYATVGSSTLIDHLFNLGICLSYSRVLDIMKNIHNYLQETFKRHGVFLPSNVKKGFFTVLVKDNIDFNASANIIKSHYHGTSLSLLQIPFEGSTGKSIEVSPYLEVSFSSKKISPLPSKYTSVQDVAESNADLYYPACPTMKDLNDFPNLDKAKKEEIDWLEAMYSANMAQGWAQHHSLKKRNTSSHVGINSIMPMLSDKVSTLKMQCHCMDMNIQIVNGLNPGQTPVDACDCPVYALTKEAQIRFPLKYKNYLSFLGQLHVEHCLLIIHGKLITGSGLPERLKSLSLSTIGTGDVVDASHIKRARYCLQVCLCALYKKLKDATIASGSSLSPLEWLTERSAQSQMCFYFRMVIQLQMEILIFVRSTREGNFKLNVEVMRSLLSWCFAFDRYYYARWLAVHVFDLLCLKSQNPNLFKILNDRGFCFSKTRNTFSSMPFDQIHEQNNKSIKGNGGATNYFNKQDESSLLRWETCGPEVARILSEFEKCLSRKNISDESSSLKHHEDNEMFRESFVKDVTYLYDNVLCNPFELDKLTSISNTSITFPESVFKEVQNVEISGKVQADKFICDRLIHGKIPLNEKIAKNNFLLLDQVEARDGEKAVFKLPSSFMIKVRSCVDF